MEVSELYKLFKSSRKICTDSRKVEPGSIFFALKGPNFNGNKFAAQALDLGASFVVIDEAEYFINERFILVPDVLIALQDLARHHRSNLEIPIIGITGSNGKTTTKELLANVLATQYSVYATAGNFNNHIGVPLSLLGINEEKHDIAIIEMGTNAPGEIKFLAMLAKPTHGLITSIGKAHLEGLIDIAGVLEEKSALYVVVNEFGGTLFVNNESELLQSKIPIDSDTISYNIKSIGDVPIIINSSVPDIKVEFESEGETYALHSSLFGDYNVLNINAALTIGQYFKVPFEQGVNAINDYSSTINRSEKRSFKGAEVFLDAYNANPSSMQLVIEQFSELEGDKILVLGDMLELGEDELEEHRYILDVVLKWEWKKVLVFGSLFSMLQEDYPQFEFYTEFGELKEYFDELNFTQCYILLKGSRGMALERLLKEQL